MNDVVFYVPLIVMFLVFLAYWLRIVILASERKNAKDFWTKSGNFKWPNFFTKRSDTDLSGSTAV